MLVSPEVVRAHVEDELTLAAPWAEAKGWDPKWDPAAMRLTVRLTSAIDREVYGLELMLDDYRSRPPFFEFVHPTTGERGVARCYPKGGRGYFHTNPVICAPWNRKAYAAHGGPHSDWAMENWATYRPHHTHLGDMLVLIQELLDDRDSYGGRMAP
jgi:hypothetical protein